MKLITFPEVLYDTQNWLFDMTGHTAEKNSDGGTGSGTPSTNKFQVERGSSYITTTGIPISKSESSGLRMIFAQSISNHYWMTSYCGWLSHNSANANQVKHSPLYDGICNSLTFNYKKYDDAVNSGRTNNRFRMMKMGMSFRDSSGSGYTRDLTPTSGQYWNLMNFGTSTATTTGTVTMSVPTNARPFGFYFQLETEGNGARYPSGSYIRIWNLKFGSTKNDEAILSPYEAQSSASAPYPRKLWTT